MILLKRRVGGDYLLAYKLAFGRYQIYILMYFGNCYLETWKNYTNTLGLTVDPPPHPLCIVYGAL